MGLKEREYGEICKSWRHHKHLTHRRNEIEAVQVDVGERIQVVPCVGCALSRCGGSRIHAASQDDEYEG